MTVDLQIGWDDLSKDCQRKIKELHEKFGGKNVKLHYPDPNKIDGEIRHTRSTAGQGGIQVGTDYAQGYGDSFSYIRSVNNGTSIMTENSIRGETDMATAHA